MSVRRQGGRRMEKRKKVSRSELVTFYKTARTKEELKAAELKAKRWTRAIRVVGWVTAIAVVTIAWVALRG